jgi:hypothetical protein
MQPNNSQTQAAAVKEAMIGTVPRTAIRRVEADGVHVFYREAVRPMGPSCFCFTAFQHLRFSTVN